MSANKDRLVTVLVGLRESVVWKPGKGERHVRTRKKAGHLPQEARLADYEALIRRIVSTQSGQVYRYEWSETSQYAVCVTEIQGQQWLVMVGLDGVMETAFVIDREGYLEADERYVYVGTLGQLDSDPNQGDDVEEEG